MEASLVSEIFAKSRGGLEPSFWNHRRVLCAMVGSLAVGQLVQVVGWVVEVRRFEKWTRFAVDDGSGAVLCCVCWNKESDPILGDRVVVRGKISLYREFKQLSHGSIALIEDSSYANNESIHWLQSIVQHFEVEDCKELP